MAHRSGAYPAARTMLRGGHMLGLADARRRRSVARGLARDLAPPPPGTFRRFGRSVIVPPARVPSPQFVEIGDGVVVHEHVWMSVVRAFDEAPLLVIGDRVVVGRCVQFSCVGRIVVGDDAIIGDSVQVGDTSHRYDAPALDAMQQELPPPLPVLIESGAMIGANSVVLP